MPFSFETTIAIINNAANELSRAARDLGDEQPESPTTEKLRGALDAMNDCVNELTTARDQAAARGTSSADAVVLRDVQRDPNGMASPGADLPAGVNADTIADDRAALEEQRQQDAERARLAAMQTSATPVVVVDPALTPTAPSSTPASASKPADASKDDASKKK